MAICRRCHFVRTLLTTLIGLFFTSSCFADLEVKGHMEKLGSHRDPHGVTMIGKFSTPSVFFSHFVTPGKPLWMRSVLETTNHPGLTEWNDTFLRMKYGNEVIKMEVSKKENRESSSTWLSLRQFLSLYTTEDIYMVQTLNNKMEDLVLIPPSLQCGGFQRAIQEAVMWLGSGKAKSVLHYDDLDNLLCLLDGQKDFLLIDRKYKHDVESDGFVESGSYSLVDVDEVDFTKFPRLAGVPWHEVRLAKGDCLFIPKRWYHQVTSSSHRHFAINLWFSHLYWFNQDNCSYGQSLYKPLEPISAFGFASPNEIYRTKLLEKVHDKGILLKNIFVSSLDTSSEERRLQFFDAIDRYQDSVLSWSELYGFDIDKAILKFPDIFDLPGEPLVNGDEKTILYDPLPELPEVEDENLEKEEDSASAEGAKNDDQGQTEKSQHSEASSDTTSLHSPDNDLTKSSQTETDDTGVNINGKTKSPENSVESSEDITDSSSQGDTGISSSQSPKVEL